MASPIRPPGLNSKQNSILFASANNTFGKDAEIQNTFIQF